MSTSETRDRFRHPLAIVIAQIGTLQSVPIAIAVLTTNLALTGYRTLLARRTEKVA